MYKEKKKKIIESYGTIKLKKYNNQNQIYFYPNFNVNKDYMEILYFYFKKGLHRKFQCKDMLKLRNLHFFLN